MENLIKILIVDDDDALCDLLAQYLQKHGFKVDTVGDGAAMDHALSSGNPDLLILDLMLPNEDGLSIAKRLRSERQIPIIMLSACGEEVDRIIGLEMGADDYLPKPFNPRELLARIRSVLRRVNAVSVQSSSPRPVEFTFGPFRLDIESQTLSRDGQIITLTQGEFALLKVFLEHPNRVMSRDQLLDQLKGYEYLPFDRSIDVRVMRLRHKIEDDAAQPCYIKTIWGQGYKFVPTGSVI